LVGFVYKKKEKLTKELFKKRLSKYIIGCFIHRLADVCTQFESEIGWK